MKRMPAPPSTASAAATIWSGVGDVKTCPGQAASSMPKPTNPAWSGSWPLPPPDTSATLPRPSAARRTNLRSGPSATMSACAAAKPSRLSVSTVSAAFISFFIGSSHDDGSFEPYCRLDKSDQFGDESRDQLLDAAVARLVPEIGQVDRVAPQSPRLPDELHAARMCAAIGFEEMLLLLRREVADLENGVEVDRRNRNSIGRVRDLRDEAAILLERGGGALIGFGPSHRLFEPGMPQSPPWCGPMRLARLTVFSARQQSIGESRPGRRRHRRRG